MLKNKNTKMKELGSGGYGKVYYTGKKYVIKELFNFDKKRLTDKRLNKNFNIYFEFLFSDYIENKELIKDDMEEEKQDD